MKRIVFSLLTLGIFSGAATAQNIAEQKAIFLKDSLAVITARVENKIIRGRYMEKNLISQTTTLKNWEGITVGLYEYKETADAPLARVYLADASAGKIAAWVITACVEATGKLEFAHTSLLIFRINEASNGQFPVLGAVVENNTPYIFKDGVTIGPAQNFPNLLDPDSVTEDKITVTKRFGRIISTTREQYNALFPGIDVTDHKWRDAVREEYKKALNSDTNNLIVAWAKANLK
ncbi:hypothetical protein [Sediminibacterium ginsengisoli]|uniref:GLPGLI family protein n=1 Tax=Sediminibacterium ginsengisoli TaxID=413434 RepID=A0A1T4RQX7_9BACT|nr:hypothetical protein [Sediminibacterium ginsengisoli]SKA18353.1 hypothetical protein SAMN04488132_11413 [Sediminibacterium ginsengisoli]